MRLRTIFFGTPEFAKVILEALIESEVFAPFAVLTQPDAPSGRGQKLQPSEVKKLAEKNNIPVFQPETLKGISLLPRNLKVGHESQVPLIEFLQAQQNLGDEYYFDLAIVAAYGRILPTSVLEAPRYESINVHGSLLPRWRGAAPIHRAILAGDTKTGICIMKMEAGLDTGPVFSEASMPLAGTENFQFVHDQLAFLGGKLLVETLPKIINGTLHSVPQPSEGVTIAPKVEPAEFEIHWEGSAEIISRQIRAFAPRPGARTVFQSEGLKILECRVLAEDETLKGEPGTFVARGTKIWVTCGVGGIEILQLQRAGKEKMSSDEFLRGIRLEENQKGIVGKFTI
jgi:methionyl-tRNA formyltransferase